LVIFFAKNKRPLNYFAIPTPLKGLIMVTSTCLKNEIPLCSLNDLEEGHSIEMVVQDRPLFAVRKANAIYAYWNICPHRGSPLNWSPNQFLSIDQQTIQCAFHGALFEIDSGLCILGPCSGDYLRAIELHQNGQDFAISAGQELPSAPVNLRAQALADLEDKE
jgi:nitrite reductase/ring-hydroxylating ferredoxin subunit